MRHELLGLKKQSVTITGGSEKKKCAF